MGFPFRSGERAAAQDVLSKAKHAKRTRSLIDRLESRVLLSATRAVTPPTVTSLALINADTDQPVVGMPTLTNGAVLNLSTLPTPRLNVKAVISGVTESVMFGYDGNSKFHLENGAPYAFAGNSGANYFNWTPTLGTHTLTATPYTADNASGVKGTARTVTFTVVNNPPVPTVSISATDDSAAELGPDDATITVGRTGDASADLVVNLAIAGTATAVDDYGALPLTVTIPAGASSITLTIHPVDDLLSEGPETVIVQAAAGPGYVVNTTSASATVSIIDDEPPPPVVSVTATDSSATELAGDDGLVTIDRTGDLSADLIVSLSISGTATSTTDYDALPTTVTIPAGFASTTLTLHAVDDAVYEGNETVIVQAIAGTGYLVSATAPSGTVTVVDDEPPPTVSVVATDNSAAEISGDDGTITIDRTGDVSADLIVSLTIGGTATAASDYVAVPQAVTIPAGASSTTITIHPVDDSVYEVTETVIVQAIAGAGYVVNATAASGTVTIADNETPPPPADQRYLYVFDAPKDKTGFFTLKRQIEVFDIDNGHKWVKNIPLPNTIYDVRGVAASAVTDRVYVSYFLTPKIGYQPGGLLCLDLNTNKVIWQKNYSQSVVPAPDRFDITPDGKKIYMPSGEFGTSDYWVVIDANTGNALRRVHHTTTAHNTIVSLDGKLAFLEGQEKQAQDPSLTHTIGVVDTATDTVIQKVGPFKDVIRPFTINGKATLVFATLNNFIGCQIASVTTGKVLYTLAPPGVPQPTTINYSSKAHGIALSSDETKVYVVDPGRNQVHVWNVAGVPNGIAPTYIGAVKVRKPGYNLAGQTDPAASNDTTGVPSWLGESVDGRYLYAEGGEIIDTSLNKVVGQLRSKTKDGSGNLVWAPYTHSRYYLEIDFKNGLAVQTGNQFGVGRMTG